MEIKIDINILRQNKLFIATPMYGGQCAGMFSKSIADLSAFCAKHDIPLQLYFLFNESLITRARNYCCDEFMRSDAQHLMFIDSDIGFNPQDIIALMALQSQDEKYDIIGGPYPKKAIKWRSVKKALEKNPNLDVDILEKVTGDYVFNPVKGTAQFNVTEPLEVLEIGTGFMMVKREVFPKFAEAFPQLRYKPDHVGQAHFDGSRYIHAYFDTLIDTVDSPTGGGSDRYLSEDYMFCQMWRKIGGSIWLCPWMRTDHIGTFHFKGDMPAVANFVGEM